MSNGTILRLLLFLLLAISSAYGGDIHALKTKNLWLIYYDQGHAYIVPHLARCFENSLGVHRRLFHYTPTEASTILLNDFLDFGHGGASSLPWNFMNIGIEPFDYAYEVSPANERMNSLMHHELAHIVATDQAARPDRFFRALFSGKVVPTAEHPASLFYSYLTNPRWYSPRWYHEGIAVFLETWMSGGIGGALNGKVILAALGQAIFSFSLGGTFMVVYGSYLNRSDNLKTNAILTAAGDTAAGLLAGLAIIPAVFAFGLEPGSGPGLIFFTLPKIFAAIPAGWLFGLLFYVGLFGAAYLSDVAAFEVLVAGVTDNTRLTRKQAVWLLSAVVFVFAIFPMINMEIFVPWDLTFGSGMQTLGCLLAVITVAWFMQRAEALKELATENDSRFIIGLYFWLRFVVPAAILLLGIWWLLTDVFNVTGGV